VIRPRQTVLDIREPRDVDLSPKQTPWGCREGCVIVSQPVDDSIGGILLLSGSSATSDTHIVHKSAVNWLEAGELVIVRPYAGTYLTGFEGIPGTVRVLGRSWLEDGSNAPMGDPSDWDIVMVFRGGEWVPLNGWQLLKREPLSVLTDSLFKQEGSIIGGTWKGREAAHFTRDTSNYGAFFTFGMGDFGPEMMLVHEDFLIEIER